MMRETRKTQIKEWLKVLFCCPGGWICLFFLAGLIWIVSQLTLEAIGVIFLWLCVCVVSGIISNKLYKTKRRKLWLSLAVGVVLALFFIFAFFHYVLTPLLLAAYAGCGVGLALGGMFEDKKDSKQKDEQKQ